MTDPLNRDGCRGRGYADGKAVHRERSCRGKVRAEGKTINPKKNTDYRMLSEGMLEVRQKVKQAEEVTSGEEVLEGIRQEEIL